MTERENMLANYRKLAAPFLAYAQALSPWAANVSELQNWISKIELELRFAAFVGMVVKTPPPSHKEFGHFMTVKDQNPEFCVWFDTLAKSEITQAAEGDSAYRLTTIGPLCSVEEVTFLAGAWLSDEEITKQATKQKTQ